IQTPGLLGADKKECAGYIDAACQQTERVSDPVCRRKFAAGEGDGCRSGKRRRPRQSRDPQGRTSPCFFGKNEKECKTEPRDCSQQQAFRPSTAFRTRDQPDSDERQDKTENWNVTRNALRENPKGDRNGCAQDCRNRGGNSHIALRQGTIEERQRNPSANTCRECPAHVAEGRNGFVVCDRQRGHQRG